MRDLFSHKVNLKGSKKDISVLPNQLPGIWLRFLLGLLLLLVGKGSIFVACMSMGGKDK